MARIALSETGGFFAIIGVMKDAALDKVLAKEKKRYSLLRRIYDEGGGSPRAEVSDNLLQQKEGLTQDEFYDIIDYLEGEHLVDATRIGSMSVSHWGIKEIEASIKHPDVSTEHFTSIVIQNFTGPIYGDVQAGGQGNIQSVSMSKKDGNEVK